MSLRNISLENYTYEMMKTQYHDLFITTRTSIQDPSIRPSGGHRSNTFCILEQAEYEGEEGCWVEDEEGLEGFMSAKDEETFRVLEGNDAFIARKVGGISGSRREKEREHRQAKRAVTNEVASNPFEKVALARRPIWPTKIRIPTTRHIGEKAKERRERKENRNSNIPMMETKVIHPMTMAKEKADKKRKIQDVRSHRREDGGARHSANCAIHRAYLCRFNRSGLGSILELE